MMIMFLAIFLNFETKEFETSTADTSPGAPTLHTPKANSKNYPVYCNRGDKG